MFANDNAKTREGFIDLDELKHVIGRQPRERVPA